MDLQPQRGELLVARNALYLRMLIGAAGFGLLAYIVTDFNPRVIVGFAFVGLFLSWSYYHGRFAITSHSLAFPGYLNFPIEFEDVSSFVDLQPSDPKSDALGVRLKRPFSAPAYIRFNTQPFLLIEKKFRRAEAVDLLLPIGRLDVSKKQILDALRQAGVTIETH